MRLVALVAGLALLAVCAAVAARPAGQGPDCAATLVRYQPAKDATLGDLPWALARPQRPGIVAFLPTYEHALRDGRVNRSDGLVLRQRGERVVWNVRGAVVARRLDGPGRMTTTGRDGRLVFSSPGCWRLSMRGASVVALVVPNRATIGCDATPAPEGALVPVRPLQAGIAAGWTWRTEQGGLLMYTHGSGPDGIDAKVLWWARRNFGGSLRLTGIRLDAPGRFHQTFQQAGTSSTPVGYRAPFPSTVVVPHAGCWLFRLRTGTVAGVVVVQAVDRPG